MCMCANVRFMNIMFSCNKVSGFPFMPYIYRAPMLKFLLTPSMCCQCIILSYSDTGHQCRLRAVYRPHLFEFADPSLAFFTPYSHIIYTHFLQVRPFYVASLRS